jgi:hypothetical protein
VLGAACLTALTQLQLNSCTLAGSQAAAALAATLSQRPDGVEHLQLQHLGLRETVVGVVGEGRFVQFATVLLHRLQQLTYRMLSLFRLGCRGPARVCLPCSLCRC